MEDFDRFVTIAEAMEKTQMTRSTIKRRMDLRLIRFTEDPVSGWRRPHLGDLMKLRPNVYPIQATPESLAR